MRTYIWQNPKYPNFTYNKDIIMPILFEAKTKQGYLLGKVASIEKDENKTAVLNAVCLDVIKSNEIEGQKLNENQVRSSVANKLCINIQENISVDRNIQGIVDMTFDAIENYDKKLSEKRLFSWHAAMFPLGFSSLNKIAAGKYRNDKNGPMQVISGPIGHERVHYEAPSAKNLKQEMKALINYVNNENKTDLIIKAAIVHLWFVIIHPFEDGNGRIARTLSDMILARSENSSKRYYSMSHQIQKARKDYYKILEITQRSSLDITLWIKWFLENLILAFENSKELLDENFKKNEFWIKNRDVVLNKRQIKILNKLLDGFEGNLTTTKWAKICSCSQDSATRDISYLIQKGILKKLGSARATHYSLIYPN